MLPPRQTCNRGNACLTCDKFTTDASYLPEHEQQLAKLNQLIEERQDAFRERTGEDVQLQRVARAAARPSGERLSRSSPCSGSPSSRAPAQAVRGPATSARATDQPAAGDTGGDADNLRAAAQRKHHAATQRAETALERMIDTARRCAPGSSSSAPSSSKHHGPHPNSKSSSGRRRATSSARWRGRSGSSSATTGARSRGSKQRSSAGGSVLVWELRDRDQSAGARGLVPKETGGA